MGSELTHSARVEALYGLAIDYFRSPVEFSSRLNIIDFAGDDFTQFLETASKPNDHKAIKALSAILQKSAKELQHAVRFLIRQHLLAKDNSYYEVFGVDENAGMDVIRPRYRAMINIFHPDRDTEDEQWGEFYASEINNAYNTLKNTEKRAEYDAELKQKPTVLSSFNPSSRPRQWRPQDYHASTRESLYQFEVWRKHPKLVLWLIAALLLVLLVFIMRINSPVKMDVQQLPAPERVDISEPESTFDNQSFSPNLDGMRQLAKQDDEFNSLFRSRLRYEPKKDEVEVKVEAVETTVESVEAKERYYSEKDIELIFEKKLRQLKLEQEKQFQKDKRLKQEKQSRQQEELNQQKKLLPANKVSPSLPVVSGYQPEQLIAAYIASWESGDVKSYYKLFAENAIRQDMLSVFALSSSRQLILDKVKWHDLSKTKKTLTASVITQEKESEVLQIGLLSLEMQYDKKSNGWLISRLDQKLEDYDGLAKKPIQAQAQTSIQAPVQAPTQAPGVVVQPINDQVIVDYVNTFKRAIDQGDINLLVGLFSDNVTSAGKAVGRTQLYEDYRGIFEVNIERVLEVSNLKWRRLPVGNQRITFDAMFDVLRANGDKKIFRGEIIIITGTENGRLIGVDLDVNVR